MRHAGASLAVVKPLSPPCGRLAPSPTGFLHLGNAWAFLLAWLAARSAGGRVILRVEDIDPQRSRKEFAGAILEDLHWLGLDWDYGPDCGGSHAPYVQSGRRLLYDGALARLADAGLTYPCFCTRRELRSMAGAPHAITDMGAPYPGTCRNLTASERARLSAGGRGAAIRLRCPDTPVPFTDTCLGECSFTLAECGGDFALRRSDGVVAYQLAAAVDDALMGVTQVVRGRDILTSTPRQILLMRCLGFDAPSYGHIPLLLDAGGERLAKRHRSLTLRGLRARGVRPERVVGLLAHLAGLCPAGEEVRPGDLAPGFSLRALPRADRRLTPELLKSLLP